MMWVSLQRSPKLLADGKGILFTERESPSQRPTPALRSLAPWAEDVTGLPSYLPTRGYAGQKCNQLG